MRAWSERLDRRWPTCGKHMGSIWDLNIMGWSQGAKEHSTYPPNNRTMVSDLKEKAAE
jgi:hypothetical protein